MRGRACQGEEVTYRGGRASSWVQDHRRTPGLGI